MTVQWGYRPEDHHPKGYRGIGAVGLGKDGDTVVGADDSAGARLTAQRDQRTKIRRGSVSC